VTTCGTSVRVAVITPTSRTGRLPPGAGPPAGCDRAGNAADASARRAAAARPRSPALRPDPAGIPVARFIRSKLGEREGEVETGDCRGL